jgi:protein-S-isoprenylcysteine O-methyltransferase Ste14
MDDEKGFRIVFGAIFFVLLPLRVYGHWRSGALRERFIGDKEQRWVGVARGVIGLALILAFLTYIFFPQWLAWAALPLPPWLRWVGAGVGVLALALLAWAQYSLGKHFSATLVIRKDHQLVTTGPYRWVRHPIYTAILLYCLAFFLLSANGIIGAGGLVWAHAIVRQRTPKEEAMLVEAFGDAYRDYMKRTGRFLPPLGRPAQRSTQ